ncbi:NAD(P)-binding protein [Terfezia boudieri ATCC MYA-4762]|uniref:NAD(P)-binding protein n=1 Tax=Terfezia boudieri ATCC MYA-4762 TaxID=1051890 RepID=A0A3N4M6N5_9PEZI|nr:NAD(P)-binding protein [Terfezia boudieri ATCC MYA-4762]
MSESQRPLEGKLGIVTGGSRGIGAAIAENLASKGCDLILNFTSPSSSGPIAAIAANLSKTYNVEAVAFLADMGDSKGPATIVDFAVSQFTQTHTNPQTGLLQIDIIINNAGVSYNRYIQDCTPEEFHKQYNINVLGPLLLVQAALSYLPHDRSGRIVNLSSVSASQGFEAQSVYGGTKAALDAMTRTWSRELAERATVNSINPGPVTTDMYAGTSLQFREKLRPFIEHTPLAQMDTSKMSEEEKRKYKLAGGREAYPKEAAGIVGMLCGKESGWCTGSVICANGGMVFST